MRNQRFLTHAITRSDYFCLRLNLIARSIATIFIPDDVLRTNTSPQMGNQQTIDQEFATSLKYSVQEQGRMPLRIVSAMVAAALS